MHIHDVLEFLSAALAIAALPVTIMLGMLIRRTRNAFMRVFGWFLWLLYSIAIRTICLPQTERTNEPTGEGLVISFFLHWGPFFAASWLIIQHWLGARENNRRGFPMQTQAHEDRGRTS
ncbi:MAG TPA: hypothetical protein VL282_11525 [Tepidisphaeraceae bacterium]|jgi:hypothetical protein|nr:hypothetical protein [Tepidisphaeraceae bacterium]